MANPTELALSTAEASALEGTTDAPTGITFRITGESYSQGGIEERAKRNRMLAMANNLRFVKTNSGLGYGVWSGLFQSGGETITYAGGTGDLADDDTNFVYLEADGTLVDNVTGFPDAPHVPIATVLTGSASAAAVATEYNEEDITDNRSGAMWSTTNQPGLVKLASQSLAFGDFTDGGGVDGFIDFDTAIPAGSLILGWEAVVSTAFDSAGTSTAVIEVGINGDTDAFSADTTQSVNTAATVGSGSLAATSYRAAATTVRVTVTEDSDFGQIDQGVMIVRILYVDVK